MPTDHVGALVAAGIMIVVGWGGLVLLVFTRVPRLGAELWLFFILLHMAITGTVMPIVRYLNMRFSPLDVEPVAGGVLVRQSVWIGLFVVISAWLQLLRNLSLPIMFFLALFLIVVEIFLRSRERNDEGR